MTNQEKELLKKLLNEAESKGFTKEVNPNEQLNKEFNDSDMISEVKQGMELLSYTVNVLGGKDTPKFIKKWLRKLWNFIKKAIADWLREVACEVDPFC